MTIFIKKIKWRFGFAVIRLGWNIYMSGYNKSFISDCISYEIEKNGIKYSKDFLNK